MENFITTLLTQINIVVTGIPKHFNESPVSTVFLVFIIFSFILNVIKRIFLWQEKRRGSPHQSCEYLVSVVNGQDCDHPSHRKYFKRNGNSCERCRGKSFKMTDAELEKRVSKGPIWKHIILWIANCSKNLLPYISFLYTLAITIYQNNK